jgi:hypothetical protein
MDKGDLVTTTTTPLELDHRVADGIQVTLLWDAASDRITVRVFDEARAETFELAVPKHLALDAFHHPYAYAARDSSLADYLDEAYAA